MKERREKIQRNKNIEQEQKQQQKKSKEEKNNDAYIWQQHWHKAFWCCFCLAIHRMLGITEQIFKNQNQ